MFDIGWLELMIIGVVALIVVGPKDLPGMFRTVGRFMGKARAMAREFQRSMEAAADDSGLKDATEGLNSMRDPLAQARQSMKDYTTGYKTAKQEKEEKAAADAADKPVAAEPSAKPPPDPADAVAGAMAKAAKPTEGA